MTKLMNGTSLDLGVCYYPEHWNRNLWAEDLDRMLEAAVEKYGVKIYKYSL